MKKRRIWLMAAIAVLIVIDGIVLAAGEFLLLRTLAFLEVLALLICALIESATLRRRMKALSDAHRETEQALNEQIEKEKSLSDQLVKPLAFAFCVNLADHSYTARGEDCSGHFLCERYPDFFDMASKYIETSVDPCDRERVSAALRPEAVLQTISGGEAFSLICRDGFFGAERWHLLQICAGTEEGHALITGTDIDGIIRGRTWVDEEETIRGNVLDALSNEYTALCYFDLNDVANETARVVYLNDRLDDELIALAKSGGTVPELFRTYVDRYVHPEDRAQLFDACSRTAVREQLSAVRSYTVFFRQLYGGQYLYSKVKISKAEAADEPAEHIAIGFAEVDRKYRLHLEELNREKTLQQMSVISALADDFVFIGLIDLATDVTTVLRASARYHRRADSYGKNLSEAERFRRVMLEVIAPEDREYAGNVSSRAVVLRELKKNAEYQFDVRLMIDGGPKYYRFKYAIDSQEPDRIIFGLLDVDELVRNEIALGQMEKEQEYRSQLEQAYQNTLLFQKAILSQAYSYYKVNLSKNVIVPPIIETDNGIPLDYSDKFDESLSDYDSVIAAAAESYVAEDYRESYREKLSSEYLIAQYRSGCTMPEYVCRIHSSKLGWHFRKYVSFISELQETGEIIAMTVAYDITEEIEREERTIRQENALLESTRAIYAHSNLTDEINALLATLINYYEADRAYIFEVSPSRLLVSNTYEYCRSGVSPQISEMQDLPIGIFNTIFEDFRENSVSAVDMQSSLSLDENSIVIFGAKDITNMLAVPVSEEGRIVGFVGVDNPKQSTRDFIVLRTVESLVHGKILQRRQSDDEHIVLEKITEGTESVFLVDFETDSINFFRDPFGYSCHFSDCGCYSKTISEYIDQFLLDSDKERARMNYAAEYIMEQLGKFGTYTFSVEDSLGGKQKKITVRVVKANESGTRAVMSFVDNTELFEHERMVQEQLRSARGEAEAANRAKSKFLFNMSHDLRTPMNAIKGFAELAEKHADDRERLLDCLSKVRLTSDHMITLVNDVLNLARIEAGSVQIHPVRTDLREQGSLVASVIQPELEAKHISYEQTAENIRDYYVLLDKTHVAQALINILNNAVKFTPDGGKIKHEFEQLDDLPDGRAYYCHTITDTGIGMSPEFCAHIFERFSRERTSTESGQHGTGLGMAITKELVELMGGSVEVESSPGCGTTVRLYLPLEKCCSGEAACSEPDGKTSLRGKRVLVVDDNELNRDIERDILSDAEMQVEEAENGAVALRMVQEKGTDYYDFVLMDIQMPVMDGYEATAAIRALPDGGRLPIIAISANAFDEDCDKSFSVGMNEHLAKPIDTSLLLKTLCRYIK